jgi:hypothetical protein
MLKMLLPTTLPMAMSPDVANSGRLVPIATMVSPMAA